MPKRTDIHAVLILGAGPIVIVASTLALGRSNA